MVTSVAGGAGVVDALQHVLPGGVKDGLVGHVAHGDAVDLHRQGVGAAHRELDHRQQDGQGRQRQQVDHHPGQQPRIAHRAPAQILDVGHDAGPEALLPPDAVAVQPDVAHAPAKDVYRAEQLPQHGARAGESDVHHVVPAPQERGRQPQRGGADAAPGADQGVFARKAQRVQPVAQLARQRQGADQGGKAVHTAPGAGADAVVPQQADALEPGPGRPQFIFRRQGRGCGWQAARLLLVLFLNQKSVSPSGGFCLSKAQKSVNAKRQPGGAAAGQA